MSKKRMPKGRNYHHGRKRKKETSQWVLVACLSVVALAGIVLCAWLLIGNPGQSKDYSYYIDLAQRYASEQRYEEAVAQYWVAINLDETQEEAYLELGELYEETDQAYNARNIYSLGYQRTNSVLLNEKYLSIERRFSGGSALENQVEKNYEVRLHPNRALVNCFATYGVSQYTQAYGEPDVRVVGRSADVQTTGDVAELRYPHLNAVLYFYNTDQNGSALGSDGRPGEDQIPVEIALGDLSLLFPDMEDGITFEELSAPELGLRNLRKEQDSVLKRTVVRFVLGGCDVVIESDEEGNIASAAAWNRVYPQKQGQSEDAGTGFSGYVVSAVDGKGVMGAQLILVSLDSGSVVQEVTSESDGSYAFDKVPDGDYVVQIKAESFQEDSFKITLDAREDNTDKNFAISPLLAEGEIRFVLSWEASPQDLDAYLKGDASDGSEVFVSYYNRQSYNKSGEVTAELDTDERNGYGPETITLKDVGGSYEMTVVDYLATGTVAGTDATVRIYTSDSAPIEVTVPDDVSNFWHVCKVENGKVEVTNYALDDSLLGSGSK